MIATLKCLLLTALVILLAFYVESGQLNPWMLGLLFIIAYRIIHFLFPEDSV